MRSDQNNSENIDVALRTKGTECHPGASGTPETMLKAGGDEDREATDTHESHADFNRNFDRIFLNGKR